MIYERKALRRGSLKLGFRKRETERIDGHKNGDKEQKKKKSVQQVDSHEGQRRRKGTINDLDVKKL